MAGYIPQNLLDEILDRIDIAELISGYFPLKRAGRNFKALCPFHHEKTPSFMVNPQKQIFHCFGCSKGGNAFSFLMEYEHMDFIEAVKTLAAKAGVALPQQASGAKAPGIISDLYKINELVSKFYQQILNSSYGAFAREYLNKRNIKDDTLKLYRLGLSPDKWDSLLNYLRSKNINLGVLEKTGLFCSRQEGGYYDRFRKRIIFPIFDVKNRVVAFGARVLAEEPQQAKYVNSPESLIYVKGRHLYGLNTTREAISQDDCAVVVEGYFDCITVYQSGMKNVVASLGTSLTLEQIRLLKRYTRNVIMVYDSDQAGQAATLRSLDLFIQESMNVRVAFLSAGLDPDSFLRKFGSKAFAERISDAKSLFDYKLEYLNSCFDAKKPEGKACIAREMLVSLNWFKDAVLQSEYVRRLAHSLDIREEALIAELKKIKDKDSSGSSGLMNNTPLKINPTEKLLINLILKETDLVKQLKSVLGPDDFQDARIARVFSVICDLTSQGQAVHPNRLIGYLNDEESASLVSEILAVDDESPLGSSDNEKILQDCINRIKKQRLSSRCQLLQKQIKIAQQQGDSGRLRSLMSEFSDLQRLRVC